jgi:hypothetical protein
LPWKTIDEATRTGFFRATGCGFVDRFCVIGRHTRNETKTPPAMIASDPQESMR